MILIEDLISIILDMKRLLEAMPPLYCYIVNITRRGQVLE